MSIEQDIGRLEGKMDLMLSNQIKSDERVTKLHERVDKVVIDQAKTKRDMKWAVIIVAGVVTGGKWLFAKIIHLFGK